MQKSTRNADCIAGRDFGDQNDGKKGQKARLPDAEREGLNASLERMRRSSNPKLNEAQFWTLWIALMEDNYGRPLWDGFYGWPVWMGGKYAWPLWTALMDDFCGWPLWMAFMDGP